MELIGILKINVCIIKWNRPFSSHHQNSYLLFLLYCLNLFQSAQKIFGGDVKTHLLLFLDTTKDHAETLEGYTESAKEFKGKVSCVFI